MIRSFRSRALRRLWEKGEVKQLPAERLERIRLFLDKLDAAAEPEALNTPGAGFHRLSGNNKGRYAISVSANWRITFAFQGEDAIEIDFEDYH